jgi:predicted MFS family arabinose efflux permease
MNPIYWLAVGAFAVGTEGFMLGGILPRIAGDLGATAAMTGQLVTVFAFAYAISSPILTALSGHFNRRSLLIAAMILFAVANLGAAAAPGYWSLMASAGAGVMLGGTASDRLGAYRVIAPALAVGAFCVARAFCDLCADPPREAGVGGGPGQSVIPTDMIGIPDLLSGPAQ